MDGGNPWRALERLAIWPPDLGGRGGSWCHPCRATCPRASATALAEARPSALPRVEAPGNKRSSSRAWLRLIPATDSSPDFLIRPALRLGAIRRLRLHSSPHPHLYRRQRARRASSRTDP